MGTGVGVGVWWWVVVVEPFQAEGAVDESPVSADGQVRADLEVSPAQFVFDLVVVLFDPAPQPVQRGDVGVGGGWER